MWVGEVCYNALLDCPERADFVPTSMAYISAGAFVLCGHDMDGILPGADDSGNSCNQEHPISPRDRKNNATGNHKDRS